VREELITAEAGSVLLVQQVVGRCGDNLVRTNKFKSDLKSNPETCLPEDDYELVVNCDASDSYVCTDICILVFPSNLIKGKLLNVLTDNVIILLL
jgi:hypothetical protein